MVCSLIIAMIGGCSLKEATGRQDFAYLISHLLIVIPLVLIVEIAGDDPTVRSFSIYDATISYAYEGDSTIPFWLALLVPLVSLLISLLVFEALAIRQGLANATEAVASAIFWLIEFIALGIVTGLLTELFKVLVGRYRPDWLARCNPAVPPSDNISVEWGQPPSDNPTCNATVSDSKIHDGQKSFPSGHSSSAFALGGFVAGYILYAQFWWPPRRYAHKPLVGKSGLLRQSFFRRLAIEMGEILVLAWALFQISWAW